MAMVKFLCPNGHPLNSPPHLVGKAGKCPKCGTAFLVPAPDDENTQDSAQESAGPALELKVGSSPSQMKSDSHVNESAPRTANESGLTPLEAAPSFTNAAAASKVSPGNSSPSAKPKVEMFYFLCPNGHKLHGPITLKGKLGQCPHCSSKFHVPQDEPEEEPEADHVPEEEEPEYHSVDENDDDINLPVEEHHAETHYEETYEHQPEEVIDAEILDLPPDSEEEENSVGPGEAFKHYHAPELDEPEFTHPLAEILATLWNAKSEEGEVEMTLENGTKFIPDLFSPTLSKRDFAVFATHDGVSYTVHSFAWKTIRYCTMNKIDDLPPGLFVGKSS